MTHRFFSVLLLGTLYSALGLSLVFSLALQPDRVAMHFDLAGRPNNWMSRAGHLTFMAVFGTAFPLAVIGICFATRYIPMNMVNIPYREYWLADERRDETCSFLGWHSVWLGCLVECLLITLHWMMVFGNRRQPVGLPISWAYGLLVPFLAALAVWIIVLLRRFKVPPVA